EAGERPGEVRPHGPLHAPGLQREAALRAADQPVGTGADAEAGLGRTADIGARERTLPHGSRLGGEDEPFEMGLLRDTDIDTELADDAVIVLALAVLALEGAAHILLGPDDE